MSKKEVDYVIEVKELVKSFGALIAVDNLSFSVKKNKIFGLLGSNGAGKTTTMNILTGLLIPDKGTVKILGLDIKKDIEKIRKHISLVPQTNSLFESLTVYENIEFFGGMYIKKSDELKKSVDGIIKSLKLDKIKDSLISKLSGGYKRICSIACALVHNPKILILDEPLVGIDIHSNELIIDLIKKMGDVTIIFTTHSIKEAEAVCDYILFMQDGKMLIEGTPKEITTNFSKHIGESVVIEFDRTIDTNKAKILLKKAGFKIKEIKLEGNTLSFETKDLGNTIVGVIDSLKSLKKHILNIDIYKPDLRKIFDYLMKNENIKGSKKRV